MSEHDSEVAYGILVDALNRIYAETDASWEEVILSLRRAENDVETAQANEASGIYFDPDFDPEEDKDD